MRTFSWTRKRQQVCSRMRRFSATFARQGVRCASRASTRAASRRSSRATHLCSAACGTTPRSSQMYGRSPRRARCTRLPTHRRGTSSQSVLTKARAWYSRTSADLTWRRRASSTRARGECASPEWRRWTMTSCRSWWTPTRTLTMRVTTEWPRAPKWQCHSRRSRCPLWKRRKRMRSCTQRGKCKTHR